MTDKNNVKPPRHTPLNLNDLGIYQPVDDPHPGPLPRERSRVKVMFCIATVLAVVVGGLIAATGIWG
jgi:hypothetical protein